MPDDTKIRPTPVAMERASENKVAVITGATGGIGKAVALAYADLGYHLVLVGRDKGKLHKLRASLGDDHDVRVADLSLVSENKRIANEVRRTYRQVHLLLNLAGIISGDHVVTEEGHELTLATNLLGPITLTRELQADRVVVTGSEAIMFAKELSPDTLHPAVEHSGFRAYVRTKALLTLWAMTEGESYGVAVADPGGTKTDMARSKAIPFLLRMMHPLMSHSPETAARAFVKAGDDLSLDLLSRKIVFPKAEKKPAERFYNKAFGDRLARALSPVI